MKKKQSSKRQLKYKKQTSTTLCNKCNRNFVRLSQHLDGSPTCKTYYDSINQSRVGSSSLRRSSRNINTSNNKNNSHYHTSTIDNEILIETSHLTDTQFVVDNNDILDISENNVMDINTHTTENENDFVVCNDEILGDTFGSSHAQTDSPTRNQHLNSPDDEKSPYEFSSIFDTLHSYRNTITFSQKQLVSLKLFEILHKSQAPMSLYKEIQEFMENSIPILMNIDKPYIISRTDLLKQMHKDIVFRGLNKKVPLSRAKRKFNNDGELNRDQSFIPQQLSSSQNPQLRDQYNNSLAHTCNLVGDNMKMNNIISKLEIYNRNQQPIELYNTSLSFSMEATKSNIGLEDCEGTFPITTFCLISSIVGLLQNPILMTEKNTIYHHPLYNDPNNNAFNPSGIYNDIHTSDWFRDTFMQVIHNQNDTIDGSRDINTKVLCPIIFFIDGVAVDSYGRMSLEPVSYTLGIFKRNVRNLAIAWRVLGYIPNTEKAYHIRYSSNKKGSNLKKKHYQQILHHILQQMSILQKNGGLIWKLPYYREEIDDISGKTRRYKEYRKVNLVFEVMVVIGDAPGNDQLCGRKKYYVPTKSMNTGVCRDCCVTYRDSDDFNYKCKFITREFIRKVQPKVRDQLSFYNVGLIAFDCLSFGCNKLGINSSTPPELLHVWYLGVVQFLIEYFLDRMTTKAKVLLNNSVSNLAKNYSRQSDRFMPKISTFISGIDKCKLTGKEKGYQLFIIYVVMNSSSFKDKIISIDQSSQKRYKVHTIESTDGKKKRKKILLNKVIDTNDKYNKWLRIFEKMISIGEWMSGKNVILKSVLEENIKVRLFSDKAVNNFTVSNTPIDSEILSNDEEEDEEETIEVNEHNVSNNMFFQSPDTVNDRSCDHRVNILVENDYENEYADNEIDEIIEPNDDMIEPSFHNDTLTVLEDDLTAYQFGGQLKKETFYISRAEYGIRLFMKEVRKVVSKEDRVRLKTVKFHQLLHFPHYIKMFGSPANIDGSRPEAIGKETAKYPGRHTQHRSDTMNYQAGCRYYENTTIDLSFCIACSTGQFDNNRENNWNTEYFTKSYVNKLRYKGHEEHTKYIDPETSLVTNQKVIASGSMVFDYSYRRDQNRPKQRNNNNIVLLNEIEVKKSLSSIQKSTKRKFSNYEKSYYKQLVKYFFIEKFLHKRTNINGTIEVFSSLKINNTIFRGCLSYYGDKEWFDWIDVIWEASEDASEIQVLPAKIIAFIHGKKFMVDNGLLNESGMNDRYPKSQYWAIIQSAKKEDGANVHVSKMSKHYSMEDTLQCIPIESIKDTAFVVPDDTLETKHNNAISIHDDRSTFNILQKGSFVSFKSTNLWANVFLEFNEGSLCN